MRNIGLIIKFTFREALSKKLILILFLMATLTLIGFIIAFQFEGVVEINKNGAKFSYDTPYVIRMIEMGFMNVAFGLGLFLAIFATANFIPDLVKKGNIDVFLSKPISREQLIFGKYLGSGLIVLIFITYLIVGLWLIVGLRFSFWETGLLFSIFSITFAFLALYSLVTFVGILTESQVLPLILTYLIFIVLNPLAAGREAILGKVDNAFLAGFLETLHYIIPNTSEMTAVTRSIILNKNSFEFEPFVITFVFLVVFLLASLFAFKRKDF